MLIWVSGLDKQVLGYITVADFCAMTACPLLTARRQAFSDGVEIYRTDSYIFGVISSPKSRPSLRWSCQQQRFEPINHKVIV
ncbi:MAG: hypothetical protein ACREJU_13325 [Nitrospiraceae bacterium]